MKINQGHYNVDEGIDLLEILKTIYNGKWKVIVITIISFMLGVLYVNHLPNKYLFSIEAAKAPDSRLFKYIVNLQSISDEIGYQSILNDNLKLKTSYSFLHADSGNYPVLYEINSVKIFNDFLEKFIQKKGIEKSLRSLSDVAGIDLRLSDEEIYSYSKKFELSRISASNYEIFFTNDSIDNSQLIISKAIENTLNLVKEDVLNDLEIIYEYSLNINSNLSDQIKKKIDHVSNGLGILDENIQTDDEIFSSAIKNNLMNLSSQLFLIENLNTSFLVKKIINEFSNEDPKTLINYNLSYLETSKIDNKINYLIVFTFIGFLFSIFLVILLNWLQNRGSDLVKS